MSAEELYSIKMRASKKENGTDVHISGAEKIVEAPDVDIFANALIERGMHHSKGEADALNLKINKVCKENIIYLDALSVETIEVETWEKGQEEIKKYLKETGIDNPQDVMQFLDETYAMRGAMLLDVDRLIRLEPDKKRGIRATNMDQERMKGDRIGNEKNHYEEAIVLATKVANCPGIIGEICISDDPPFITLVDISKNELSTDIEPFIVRCGSTADIDKIISLESICLKIRLISTHLTSMQFSMLILEAEHSTFKGPGIQPKFILRHILKSDAFHFFI